jgi:Lysozyme like domain
VSYTPAQLTDLAAANGFSTVPDSSGYSPAQTMGAIAYAESTGNPNAINNEPNGTTSYGLTQINSSHPGAADALDPNAAFQQAYTISKGGTNFGPWSTYSGAGLSAPTYSQYLPETTSSDSVTNAAGSASPNDSNCSVFGSFFGTCTPVTSGGNPSVLSAQATSSIPTAITDGLDAVGGTIAGQVKTVLTAAENYAGRGVVMILAIVLVAAALWRMMGKPVPVPV